MEWEITLAFLKTYGLLVYYVFIYLLLPKIVNFCTRPNWHPIANLLTVNLAIFLIGFPVYFLGKANTVHYTFATLVCVVFLLNYIFLLFAQKEHFYTSADEEKVNLPEVYKSAKNTYFFGKNFNRQIFGKDYLSHKDALLVVIFMFPYLDLFTKNPISLFLLYFGFIIIEIAIIFLYFKQAK